MSRKAESWREVWRNGAYALDEKQRDLATDLHYAGAGAGDPRWLEVEYLGHQYCQALDRARRAGERAYRARRKSG